jgi:hypothetical protein
MEKEEEEEEGDDNPVFQPKPCTCRSRLVNYELIQHVKRGEKKTENKAMEGWLGTK